MDQLHAHNLALVCVGVNRISMIRVSGPVLRDLLRLPEHWTVQRVVPPILHEYDDAIVLVVTGTDSDLPEVELGQILPELIATYTRQEDGSITVAFETREALGR